jgi:hypothetical protein
VRFDRHALYLGTPGREQVCRASAIGRTEAILIQPATGRDARVAVARTLLGGSGASFAVRAAGVVVTATWEHRRSLIARALGRSSLPAPARASAQPARAARARGDARAHAAQTFYTGPGFDACHAPSSQQMSAWAPTYQAIGVYVGGANAACPPGPSNPNLTASWVSQQIAAGWHLVPAYVGLQAPSNSCGCAAMSSTASQASAEGTAAANDAVSDMQALGLPGANPIYFDMEAYTHNATNTNAVLAFLAAWTSQLHADGYVSGVYSSTGSGVADLSSQWGTGYPEPDDIWFAEWNGQASTTTRSLPAAQWSNHQRLHQYQGDHNETHGGVKMDVDSDYLDGATADSVGAPASVAPPSLSVTPAANGTTILRMSWPQGSGQSQWQVLGGPTPTALVTLAQVPAAAGASAQVRVRGTNQYFEVQALGAGSQVLASSAPVATPAHLMTFGHSAFVAMANGTGGVPVGCYTGAACHLSTTITAGRTMLAQTGPEAVGAGQVGLLFFRLTGSGRALLAHARGMRLPVSVTVRDRSGASTSGPLNLVGFITSGRSPRRIAGPATMIRIVGLTSFVSIGGVGGVLTACVSPTPCSVSARLSLGRTVLAQTGNELIGSGEAAYVTFKLSARAQNLLRRTTGNQLGASAELTAAGASSNASIVLTRF